MASITAYFDESYSQPPVPVVYTIAGYVATVDKWIEFQKQWQSILDREKLPPFSMKNFSNQYDKIYGGWGEKRKDALLSEFHQIIKETYIRSFSTSIIVADYDALPFDVRYAFGEPHLMAAINCFKHISQWKQNARLQEPILYVFENGAKDEKSFKKLIAGLSDAALARYGIEKFAFDGKNMQPLQAADMLAYETRKEAGRRLLSPEIGANTRENIQLLNDPLRDDWFVMDKTVIEETVNYQEFKDLLNDEDYKAFVESAKERGELQ